MDEVCSVIPASRMGQLRETEDAVCALNKTEIASLDFVIKTISS